MSLSFTILLFNNFLYGETVFMKFGVQTQTGQSNIRAENQVSWPASKEEKTGELERMFR